MEYLQDRIKKIIEESAYSQRAVAQKIGMSTAGFYRMLGSGTIKVSVLQDIADLLNVPIIAFFENTHQMNINIATGDIKNTGKIHVASKTEEVSELEYKLLTLEKEIENLKVQLAMKDEIIALLKERK